MAIVRQRSSGRGLVSDKTIGHFSFSPSLRGEGWDEGQLLAPEPDPAPHPNPLPVRTGRGDSRYFIWLVAHFIEDQLRFAGPALMPMPPMMMPAVAPAGVVEARGRRVPAIVIATPARAAVLERLIRRATRPILVIVALAMAPLRPVAMVVGAIIDTRRTRCRRSGGVRNLRQRHRISRSA